MATQHRHAIRSAAVPDHARQSIRDAHPNIRVSPDRTATAVFHSALAAPGFARSRDRALHSHRRIQ
ncbi:hypothetical protein BGLA2_1700003 [Burkholderia gladioli]|nr:hypothetical protein BGLA2_1700003 [Burkholderia gladioli]